MIFTLQHLWSGVQDDVVKDWKTKRDEARAAEEVAERKKAAADKRKAEAEQRQAERSKRLRTITAASSRKGRK
jgi:hypothetical protein